MPAFPFPPSFRPRRTGLPGFGGGRKLTPKRAVFLFLTLLTAAFGYVFCQGKVVRVHDGDTVTVLSGGEMLKVRLYGVDAPESAQKGGADSRRFAADLASFQEVKLEVRDKDRYGRSVAIVRLPDGRTLNEELVRAGHAWVYPAYCNTARCAYWQTLEAKAKDDRNGLWRDKNPVPPWQWRRYHTR